MTRFYHAIIFKSIFFLLLSLEGNTQNDSLKNRYFSKYIDFGIGATYGPENIVGLPSITLGLKLPTNFTPILGVKFATFLGFTYSYGTQIGFKFKPFIFEYSNNKFNNSVENFKTKTLKIGIRHKRILLKVGNTFHFSKFDNDIYEGKFPKLGKNQILNFELLFGAF
jgi:hypothetical protein